MENVWYNIYKRGRNGKSFSFVNNSEHSFGNNKGAGLTAPISNNREFRLQKI